MKIEIYGKETCPYCQRAKEAFKYAKLPYTEYVVGKDVSKQDIQDRINSLGISHEVKTVPQIFIDDNLIGGYTDLIQKYPWAMAYHNTVK